MSCGKCGSGKGMLCPVSLGLALGITSGLAFLLWSAWVMYYGDAAVADMHRMVVASWGAALTHSLMVFVKGFVFGFFLALFYDLFHCCMKKCCKKDDSSCACCADKSCCSDKSDMGKKV